MISDMSNPAAKLTNGDNEITAAIATDDTTKGHSDSGATINIIADVEATRLQLARHVLPKPIRIRYGKQDAYSIATHYIKGNGLIKMMVIVADATLTLVSTRLLTDQGFEVRYTDANVVIYDPLSSKPIFSGSFDQKSRLWQFDLKTMLMHTGIPPTPEIPTTQGHRYNTRTKQMTTPNPISYAAIDEEIAYSAITSMDLDEQLAMAATSQGSDNLIQYISKLLCSPPDSTLIDAIDKRYIDNLPGNISAAQVRASPPNSINTGKGHMKMVRQIHSKKPVVMQAIDDLDYEAEEGETLHYTSTDSKGQHWAHITIDSDEDDEEAYLQPDHIAMVLEDEETGYAKDELLIWGITDLDAMTHDEQKKRTLWTDATGPLPTTSSDGSRKIMLFVLNNYVHAECIANDSAQDQVRATENAINFFIDRGQHIARQVLDNLCPKAVTDLLRKRRIPFLNVPAGNHRYNRAEPYVGLFKNRFISMRAGLDPRYPITTEWHRLIPRVEVAINITIPSLKDPSITAWHGVNGMRYDFSKFPLALPGCRVLVYEARPKRKSWEDHGTVGFCLEPSFRHFRAQRVFIPSLKSERITSSIAYYPHKGYVPGYSNVERLAQALSELSISLNNATQAKEIEPELAASVIHNMREMRRFYEPMFTLVELTQDGTNPNPLRPDPSDAPSVFNQQNNQLIDEDAAMKRINEASKIQVDLAARLDLYDKQRAMARSEQYDDEIIVMALHQALLVRKARNEDNPTITKVLNDPILLEEWMPAIMGEIDGLIKVGALVPASEDEALTKGNEILPNIIQLKRKRNPNGTVKKLKARLCMNGNIELNQFHMFDNSLQNFAPNASYDTILQLLCFSIRRGWKICGLDITQAYVMTPYNRAHPTYTYTEFKGKRQYYKLKRMVYGLPDAGRAWYDFFKDFFLAQGYTTSEYDPCLFIKITDEENGIATAVTTDDCLISHSDNNAGQQLLKELLAAMDAKGWEYTFEPVVQDMLGIEFNWNTGVPGALLLRTPSKIHDLRQYFFPDTTNEDIPKVYHPFPLNWTPATSEISETNPAICPTKFRKGLGLIPYNYKVRNKFRIGYCKFYTKAQTPSQADYNAAKHLAAYLRTTLAVGLCSHPASSVNGINIPTFLVPLIPHGTVVSTIPKFNLVPYQIWFSFKS